MPSQDPADRGPRRRGSGPGRTGQDRPDLGYDARLPRFDHNLLARARTELGLTQEAAAAAVGVDVRTYRRYESGAVNDAHGNFEVRNASRRQLLACLCRELGLTEAELVVDPPLPTPWTTCHAHTLPRAPHFVGRAELLARLDGFARCLALVAVGGAGKTSVVERWLASRGDGPHPGGTFVWSFYDDDRAEACLSRALCHFARTDTPPPGDPLGALQLALAAGPPHLLVLDGLEVMQAEDPRASHGRVTDGALRRLLVALARGLGRARVLITSRLPLGDLAAYEGDGLTTIRLGDLSDQEGRALLARWGLTGDPQKFVTRVGGHALSIAMLGSYAGAFLGGDARHLDALDLERLDALARDDVQARRLLAVLSAYARALAPVERDVLARLALFPGGADVELLTRLAGEPEVAGALAGHDEPTLTAVVARLARLGLIAPAGPRRFAAHPFVAEYFRSQLAAPGRTAIHELERRHLVARLDRHTAGPDDLLDTYESLLVHTLRAGRAAEALAIYHGALGGFDRLGLRLGAMSRGLRILQHFSPTGDPARVDPDLAPARRARVVYDWGLYAGALGDLRQALACYRVHAGLVREAGDLVGLTTSLRTRAYTERLTGDLAGALTLAHAAVDVATRAGSRGDLARGLALVAHITHDLGRPDEAADWFARVRAAGDRPFARRSLWEAEHLLETGDLARARSELLANLPGLDQLGWAGHAAHAHTLLGLVALAGPAPDSDEARDHLADARTWATTAGEVEVVLRCHELAARIALADGDPETAAAELTRGRTLAETCGFNQFLARLNALAGAP